MKISCEWKDPTPPSHVFCCPAGIHFLHVDVHFLSNTTAEWLYLQLHTREILFSNLSKKSQYPEFFMVILSSSRQMLVYSTSGLLSTKQSIIQHYKI